MLSGLSEGVRVKLNSEVTTPFRFFRKFVFLGVGAAAGLGVFIRETPGTLNPISLNDPYYSIAITFSAAHFNSESIAHADSTGKFSSKMYL